MRIPTLLTCLSLSLISCASGPSGDCATCPVADSAEPLAQGDPANLEELLGAYRDLTGENLTYDAATADFLRRSSVTRVGPTEAEVLLVQAPTSDASAHSSTPEFELIILEYAEAGELAETLRQLVQDAAGTSGTGAEAMEANENEVSIVADEATNSILVRGSRARLGELKELIALLDVEANGNG